MGRSLKGMMEENERGDINTPVSLMNCCNLELLFGSPLDASNLRICTKFMSYFGRWRFPSYFNSRERNFGQRRLPRLNHCVCLSGDCLHEKNATEQQPALC